MHVISWRQPDLPIHGWINFSLALAPASIRALAKCTTLWGPTPPRNMHKVSAGGKPCCPDLRPGRRDTYLEVPSLTGHCPNICNEAPFDFWLFIDVVTIYNILFITILFNYIYSYLIFPELWPI